MDPNDALRLSHARMRELQAEAAANRLASAARRTRTTEARRLAAAGGGNRSDIRWVARSSLRRLWALVRRTSPAGATDSRT